MLVAIAHRPVAYLKAAGVGFIPAKSGRSALSVWFATNEPSQAKAFENFGIPRNLRAFINIKFNENVPVALAEPTNEFDFLLSATFW